MYKFLDSNIFQDVIIFVVGLFVFFLYRKQKKDEVKSAATIVILEIRSIEESLDKLRGSNDYYESIPVIQINSWEKYKHLFTNKLTVDEYKVINDFYKHVYRIEQERRVLREQIEVTIIEKAKVLQNQVVMVTDEMIDQEFDAYKEKISKIEERFSKSKVEFISVFPIRLINRLLQEVNVVTATPAITKLNAIAKA